MNVDLSKKKKKKCERVLRVGRFSRGKLPSGLLWDSRNWLKKEVIFIL